MASENWVADSALNKIKVAKQQIESAIRLHLYYSDLISSHTLVQASLTILEDICDKKGIEYDFKPLKIVIKDVLGRKGFDDFYRHRNFFKHADRDAFQEIEQVKPEWNDILIFAAIRTYVRLVPLEKNTISLFGVYMAWYVLINKKLFLKYKLETAIYLDIVSIYEASDLEKFEREDLLVYGAALIDFFDEHDDRLTKKIKYLRSKYGSAVNLPMIYP